MKMEEFVTSRRNFVKQGLVVAGGLLTGLSSFPAWAARSVRITILHTNDTHSRIDPYPDNGPNAGRGGVAARMRLIKQIRESEEHVLLFDAGDIFQGTPYFNFFKGALEMKAMQMMGYDAATMGNHDFDEGVENFDTQLKHVKFPFVVANYDFQQTVLRNKIKPYTVFIRGGIRIGVFGLGINPAGLIPDKLFGAIVYHDPIAKAKQMVQMLRMEESCHYVVCLSHLGYAYDDLNRVSDMRLAEVVDGIDLIIGGHTHTFLQEGTLVKGSAGRLCNIVQVGHSGLQLGRVDLLFEMNKSSFKSNAQALGVK